MIEKRIFVSMLLADPIKNLGN